jgi:hypothetical protein
MKADPENSLDYFSKVRGVYACFSYALRPAHASSVVMSACGCLGSRVWGWCLMQVDEEADTIPVGPKIKVAKTKKEFDELLKKSPKAVAAFGAGYCGKCRQVGGCVVFCQDVGDGGSGLRRTSLRLCCIWLWLCVCVVWAVLRDGRSSPSWTS